MSNKTPAAKWRENGEPDPFPEYLQRERHELPMGHLTDDEMANTVFMEGDLPFKGIVALTAGKERIRWLSRKLVAAEARIKELETK